ncbi:Rieske (2Fe-2S) protein [Streptomyces sp. H27-D2]|uniref:Rieske (2Fe-2S) protein n=1 Tax=Streptomyces sp. H27-D2 TaxID=3046304 RepID=UPI002DB6667F|nr:Rieske (2Fe-2S) protein [Streptomyces sp. H27-D2]MEC4020583.1 Rieske (2Fe-2S) protein [Streptomyces sp. H27-D2]
MTRPTRPTAFPARRTVVAPAGAAGLAAALAACGGSDSDKESTSQQSEPERATPAKSQPGESGAPAGGGEELAKAADIPQGGGTVFKDQKVVVTQPKAGEFKAFSAVCTHAGCLVKEVQDGTINCLCHGSKYRIADGSVAHGPTTKPLPAAKISVDGDSLRLG